MSAAQGTLHVAFVMLHPGFVRHYAGVLRGLVAAGHRVTLSFESARNKIGEQQQLVELLEQCPSIAIVPFSEVTPNRWHYLGTAVRLLQDYARYFVPSFAAATALRSRAAQQLPPLLARVCETACATPVGRRLFGRLLEATERVIPIDPAIYRFVRDLAPDVLLVTPLVDWGSSQVECLKSAAALGIPSALCVASWDNLTNKGAVRYSPTRVIVWNDAQRREAIEFHGIAAAAVVVTGAQTFDHWFGRQPSRSREAFCGALGLDPSQAILLYLGSSFFIAPDEAQFFHRFLRAVRQSPDARLRDAGVIVRPHPLNIQQWLAFDFSGLGRVAVFPTSVGVEAFSEAFRDDFFNSLHHAAVVAGVNTSAMIEAGIAGRAVFTVLAPEFTHSQAGTMHFQHLTSEAGGIARAVPGIDEALAGMSHALAAPEEYTRQAHRYVAAFVRPRGWDTPAAVHLQGEIEALARLKLEPEIAGAWAGRLLLAVPSVAATLVLRQARKKSRRKGPLGSIDGTVVRVLFVLLVHLASIPWWLEEAARVAWRGASLAYRRVRRVVKRTAKDAWRAVARVWRRSGQRIIDEVDTDRLVRKPARRAWRRADSRLKQGRRLINQGTRQTQRGVRRSVRGMRHLVSRLLSRVKP